MRLCSTSSAARVSSFASGISLSSATGLWSSSRQRAGSRSRNRLDDCGPSSTTGCGRGPTGAPASGAMKRSRVRASLTMGATWVAASASMRISSALKARASMVWTTSTPWRTPRSIRGTPRKDW